ncbi:solute carrier organic anion transporter family member 4A1-like isoform X2 [Babylonia areolata]
MGEEKGSQEKKETLQGVSNVAYVTSADDVIVTTEHVGPTSSQEDPDKLKESSDQRYGCGSFKPSCLRRLGNIRVFVFLAVLLCLTEGYAVNGIANSALLHLEKQFGLKSTQSALISSAQDIGALVVVLFVSYLGARHSKPHWVALGSVVMALGSFLFIVPHLATSASPGGKGPPPPGVCTLTEPHTSTTTSNTTNTDNADTSTPSSGPSSSSSSSSNDLVHYLGLFMVANMVHGIGFCPMFTLGTVYIDENAEHSVAALYVGMTYAAAALGVAVGFFTGGQISERYYVDFDTIDQSKLAIGPRDPQWIGAWWIGFIPSCVAFVLLALPIYGFPKTLPSGENKADEVANGKAEPKNAKTSVCKDIFLPFFIAVKKLVVNVPFLFLCLSSASETLIISGMSSFAFKMLSEQYSISFDEAGNLLGGLIILGGVGMVGGGLIIRLFRLQAPGMCLLNGALDLLAVALGFAFLASCPEVRLAGQDVPYPGDTSIAGFSSICQGSCECEGVAFAPVCGVDRTVYFSPCHAGCLSMDNPGPMATFHNCTCVAHALNVSTMADNSTANNGRCVEACDNRSIFLPCLFLMFFAVLLTTTPNSMACLRIVNQDLRPFALGFQWMVIRLLGTIPGPPLVGYILDRACLVWSGSPDGSQFCAMYSKWDMSLGVFIWWTVVNLLAGTLHFLAAAFLRVRHSKSVDLRSVPT